MQDSNLPVDPNQPAGVPAVNDDVQSPAQGGLPDLPQPASGPVQPGQTPDPSVEPAKEEPISDTPGDVGVHTVPSISDMAKPVSPPPVEPGTDDNLVSQQPAVGGELGRSSVSPSTLPQEGSSQAADNIQPAAPGGDGQVSDAGMPQAVKQPPSMPANVGGSMPPGSAPLDSQVPGSGQPQVPSAEIPAGIAPVSEQQPAAAETQATGATDELKKTHEPVIILPDRLEMGQMVNAKVKVGMIGHVMDSAHYIESIELFLNDQSIGKVDLKLGENIVAEADFQVSLVSGSQLKAVAICNVHGKWECVRGIQ